MSYEVLTEREAYSFVNFMSDVGGQAGLWLGASIITLFEFLYFLFRLFTLACRKKRARSFEHRMQYDSTGRRHSFNEPGEHKKSLGDIRLTLTPAHSIEDINLDDQREIDTRSLEEKLDSIRNANFAVTV
jgi:hypothetical protein